MVKLSGRSSYLLFFRLLEEDSTFSEPEFCLENTTFLRGCQLIYYSKAVRWYTEFIAFIQMLYSFWYNSHCCQFNSDDFFFAAPLTSSLTTNNNSAVLPPAPLFFRPRRKLQIPLEALFMIDFPTRKHKFSFFLDRKNQRVTIDINSGLKIYSKHFNVATLNETSTVRSLALLFRQSNVTLYMDCKKLSEQDLEVNISRLYTEMDEPVLKLVNNHFTWLKALDNTTDRYPSFTYLRQFRERKYPLHFDNSVANALLRANCQKSSHRRENRKYLKEGQRNRNHQHNYLKFDSENLINDQAAASSMDKNKKRDIRDWHHEERYRSFSTPADSSPHRRGDIPVIHGDCDGES